MQRLKKFIESWKVCRTENNPNQCENDQLRENQEEEISCNHSTI
jgi:hypothetical protein